MGFLAERRARKAAELEAMVERASAQPLTNPSTPPDLLERLVAMGDPAIIAKALADNLTWTGRASA